MAKWPTLPNQPTRETLSLSFPMAHPRPNSSRTSARPLSLSHPLTGGTHLSGSSPASNRGRARGNHAGRDSLRPLKAAIALGVRAYLTPTVAPLFSHPKTLSSAAGLLVLAVAPPPSPSVSRARRRALRRSPPLPCTPSFSPLRALSSGQRLMPFCSPDRRPRPRRPSAAANTNSDERFRPAEEQPKITATPPSSPRRPAFPR